MNDKDKEAFEKWFQNMYDNCAEFRDRNMCDILCDEKEQLLYGWQAACEYKQEEVNELTSILDLKKETIVEMQNSYETLNAHDEMLIATVDKLKEENEKLRDALKFYANRFSWTESEHPTHEYYAGAIRNDDSLVEYTEADGDVFKDFSGGKLARQVLKELEDK